jgi:hypothetical protein
MIALYLLCNIAFSGEPVDKGFVIKEPSYVFTIPEAQALMTRVSELEKKEKLYGEQVELIKVLDEKQIILKSTIEIKDKIIEQHKQLIDLEKEKSLRLERKDSWNNIKIYSAFVFGFSFAVGSFIAADNIADTLERN